MPKTSASYEMALPHRDPHLPAYQWLYEAVRSEILGGRLAPGTRLPATRDLASQYGLARGTIVNAFDQLKSEGYIEGSVGSGTFVSRTLPEELLDVGPTASMKRPATNKKQVVLSDYGQRTDLFPGYGHQAT